MMYCILLSNGTINKGVLDNQHENEKFKVNPSYEKRKNKIEKHT